MAAGAFDVFVGDAFGGEEGGELPVFGREEVVGAALDGDAGVDGVEVFIDEGGEAGGAVSIADEGAHRIDVTEGVAVDEAVAQGTVAAH